MEKILSGDWSKMSKLTASDVTPQLAVHVWLIAFMSGVGVLKFLGFMGHKNSHLVGLLELIGGAVFLPAWTFAQQPGKFYRMNLLKYTKMPLPMLEEVSLGKSDCYVLGSCLIMTALGLVTADKYKHFSPVCWIHAAMTLAFCYLLKLPTLQVPEFNLDIDPIAFVAAFMLYGHILGRLVGTQPEKKSTKTKPKIN